MKTYDPKEVLAPKDIFSIPDKKISISEATAFIVLGFRDECMRVAELNGKKRDDRRVLPKGIPEPGEFEKYEIQGFQLDPLDRTLTILRNSWEDLQTAKKLGKQPILWDTHHQNSHHPYLKTTLEFSQGLFTKAIYYFGRKNNGVTVVLSDFNDAILKRAFPTHLSPHKGNGVTFSSTELFNNNSSPQERWGVFVHPEIYIPTPHQPLSTNSISLNDLYGYMATLNKDTPRPTVFKTLKEAHDAVSAIHQSTLGR